MKNNYTKYLLLWFIVSLEKNTARSFLTPYVDYWSQYNYTYPLFCDIENSLNKNLTIGVSLYNRSAFSAWKECGTGGDFSLLLHGKDRFFFSDTQAIPSTVNGDYTISPSYRFDKSTVNVYFEYSPNIKSFCNDYGSKNINFKVKVKVPFHKQTIHNFNNADMILSYNTSSSRAEKKINNKTREKAKKFFNKPQIRSIDSSSHFDIKTDAQGNNVFALGFDFINYQFSNNTVIFEQNDENPPTICVFNKFLPPESYLDTNNKTLSIDNILSSAQFSTIANSYSTNLVLKRATSGNSSTDIVTFSDALQRKAFYHDPLSVGYDNRGGTIVPLYLYTQPSNYSYYALDTNNSLVKNSMMTEPDIVEDINYGDHISLSAIVVGNAFTAGNDSGTFVLENSSIPQATILRIIATGQYNYEVYDKSSITFTTPPVCVQKTSDGSFPTNYGLEVTLPNHDYVAAIDGTQQFNPYDSLTLSEDVTLLLPDGTFLDNSKSKAVLWYGYNYHDLFTSDDYATARQKLFLTTTLTSPTQTNAIAEQVYNTLTSSYDIKLDENRLKNIETHVFGNSYDPTTTDVDVNTLKDGLAFDVYNTTSGWATKSNTYSQVLYEQHVIKHSVNNSADARAENSNTPLLHDPKRRSARTFDSADDYNDLTKKTVNNGNSPKGLSSAYDQFFVNETISSNMQYNESQQIGFGNVDCEIILGTYFDNNNVMINLYGGFEFPTAEPINNKTSYLAMPLENNGHYAIRLGSELMYDFVFGKTFRLFCKGHWEHVFSATEKIIPRFDGFDVFGLIPIKIDTDVSWNSILLMNSLSLYISDFSGMTFGYQYWKKFSDNLRPRTANSEIIYNDFIYTPTLCGFNKYDKRSSHTLNGTIFSRLTDECMLEFGLSKTLLGYNTGNLLDIQASITLDF